MAASGGDTVVPTNWSGLIMVAVVIMVIATATYFGMDMKFGSSEAPTETEESLSVKDVFSASARREIAAAEPARVLSRAELEAQAPAQDSVAEESDNASASTTADDDWSSDADSWDTHSDDWDSVEDSEQSASAPEQTKMASQAPAAATPQPIKPTPRPTAQATAAPAPKPTSRPPAQSDKTAPARRQPPSADALTAWWKDAAGDLSIRFAGTLDKGDQVSDGIAVMFSEPVDPAQGQQHMQLRDMNGNPVSGQWKAAANPALLIMEGLKPGRYSLSITKDLQGRSGKSLADDASGAVYVY